MLWTIKDVCERTQIKDRSIYYLIQTGQIPHVRLADRIIRFEPEAIEQWIAARRQEVREKAKEGGEA